MEEPRPDSPQLQPSRGDKSSDRSKPPDSASAETLPDDWEQADTPMDAEAAEDSAALSQCHSKPLWKPIPPLVPEAEPPRSPTADTRDQSCQTDESSQQTCPGRHSRTAGGWRTRAPHFLLSCRDSQRLRT